MVATSRDEQAQLSQESEQLEDQVRDAVETPEEQPAAPREAEALTRDPRKRRARRTEQAECPEQAERKEVRRPRSAYSLFQGDFRKQVVDEIGSGHIMKVAPALAAKWRSLDPEEKAKYEEQAKELRVRYFQELANGAVRAVSRRNKRRAAAEEKAAEQRTLGTPKRGTGPKKEPKTVQTLKNQPGPKKPQSSYSLWLCENRRSVTDGLVAEGNSKPSFADVGRAASKTWLALTEEQKAPYVERCRILNTKFKELNRAAKEYKQEHMKATMARAKLAKKRACVRRRTTSKARKEARADTRAKKCEPEPSQAQEEEPTANSSNARTPRKHASQASRPTPMKVKKVPAEQTTYLDLALVAEAAEANLAGAFCKLVEREDMKSYPQRVLLDALVASGGLLDPAREAVLARHSQA